MDRPDGDLSDGGLDLSFAGPPVRTSLPTRVRWFEVASTYLPLLLMALLAAATWWLVRNAPVGDPSPVERPVRHEPDYAMTGFLIQRFAANGLMRTQIEGDRLRHYPDTDTLEIDNPRIRAVSLDGSVTLASAHRALANGDGSELQLFVDAQVVRPATAGAAAIEFRGEFLHAFRNIEQVRSHLPITLTQGATTIRADGMAYDNLARTVDLRGHSRAVFETASKRPIK